MEANEALRDAVAISRRHARGGGRRRLGECSRWRRFGHAPCPLVRLVIREQIPDRRDEPAAPAGQRLDEPWGFRRITQGVAEPAHGSVEAMLEIHERIRRPQRSRSASRVTSSPGCSTSALRISMDLSGTLRRLSPLGAPRAEIELEDSELHPPRRRALIVHG
jgi:hypothetical protein